MANVKDYAELIKRVLREHAEIKPSYGDIAVEMIFDLEEKFDIEIPYNANTNNPRTEFETVADVVRAIQALVDKKNS